MITSRATSQKKRKYPWRNPTFSMVAKIRSILFSCGGPRCDIYYRIEDKYFHSWESFDSQLDTNLLFQLDCRHRGRYTNFLQYFRGSRDLELWAKIQNILMVYILTGNFAYKVFTPLAPPSWHKLLTTPPLINKTRCVPSSSSLSLLLPLQPSWLLLTELLVRLILYNIHRFLWG